MMTGLNPQRVIEALEFLKAHPAGSEGGMRTVGDYAVPNVSEKVSRIILSYTDYVNRRFGGRNKVHANSATHPVV